ncbi:hypothetical protein [Williamsia sp. 1138]|uniref:hypothetical protein n=1 Tax=Williamsia sp. 1138 TaxID=1903117 RepID=UPI00143D73D2|nr:hypothetical protein [Williamsia sp. 1138]
MTLVARHPMTPTVPPEVISDIYSPDEIAVLFDVVRRKGPWRLIAAQHFATAEEYLAVSGPKNPDLKSKLTLSDLLTPTFRSYLGNFGIAYEDEVHDLYFSRKMLNMIKSIHGAKYATPQSFLFNLRAPAHSYDAGHFDGSSWRGINSNNSPLWLISIMAKSGLFDEWEVKSGQVIAYYYNSDIDGGFTYWPEGPDLPPKRVPAPFWNNGFLTNNEKMFHRGEASGPRGRRTIPDLQLNSLISGEGDNEWVIRNDGTEIARYEDDEMRFLFHYSAHVFDDLADVKRYVEHTDDLTVEKALGMILDDLKRRGEPVPESSDPMNDSGFIAALSSRYAMAPSEYPVEAPLDVPTPR